MKEIMTIIWNL